MVSKMTVLLGNIAVMVCKVTTIGRNVVATVVSKIAVIVSKMAIVIGRIVTTILSVQQSSYGSTHKFRNTSSFRR